MQTKQRIADLLAGLSDPDVAAVADFCAYLQYRSAQNSTPDTPEIPAPTADAGPPAAAPTAGALLAWATEVVAAMTEASFWVDYERELAAAEQRAGRYRLRSRLSTLADCGRWYFPNLQADSMGLEKELAYRGVRQLALSAIIYAFEAVPPPPDETDEQRKQRGESIVRAKRQFVSEVQVALQAAIGSEIGPPHKEQP